MSIQKIKKYYFSNELFFSFKMKTKSSRMKKKITLNTFSLPGMVLKVQFQSHFKAFPP